MRVRSTAVSASLLVGVLVVSACGAGRDDNAGGSGANGAPSLIVGTTDKVTSLDPASAYDNGSSFLQNNVFSFLMTTEPGTGKLVPDAAQKCSFVQPTVYECTMKPGLKFANGNPIDANAAAFSFNRIMKINDANGPASLLENLVSVRAKDAGTVDFTVKKPNDQTFPLILGTPAGPLMDPKTISADAKVTDQDVIRANAFSGPYIVTSYDFNKLVELKPNPNYQGALGKPKNDGVTIKTYDDSTNMKLDIENGNIDVASRQLSPDDISSLKNSSKVKVVTGPGGQIGYLTFNLKTMPGGTSEQKLAIRKAIASSVDREAITRDVFKGTASPLYSMVASTFDGSIPVYQTLYGSKPDAAKARGYLSQAGISTPVTLNLQYTTDHYGPTSGDAFAALKAQLEQTGLFKVAIKGSQWNTFSEERVTDLYPIYQMGWFPDFPDADNYLSPFLTDNNFLKNHFSDPQISDLLSQETSEPDPVKRKAIIENIQQIVAEKFIPTLPLWETNQQVVTKNGVTGAVLDNSFKFRLGTLTKS